ncbi:hypothetical protein ZIOFF_067755 [Zingiber officinale]|uniref:Uncharacterized protein n=1 Tax=Zingiber officinale TaxID=94328 RepID=A0A8J5ERB4_ZINOF|nr:hypothetical protein ZIOFF_067755 [Zingiber officinale]
MSQFSIRRFSFSGFLMLAVARSRGTVIALKFPVFGASLKDLYLASNQLSDHLKCTPSLCLNAESSGLAQSVLGRLVSNAWARREMEGTGAAANGVETFFFHCRDGHSDQPQQQKLQSLIVDNCVGFEADEEIFKKASGIELLRHEGCRLLDQFAYDTDECDPLDLLIL